MTNEDKIKGKSTEDFALFLWSFATQNPFFTPDKNFDEIIGLIDWLKSESEDSKETAD